VRSRIAIRAHSISSVALRALQDLGDLAAARQLYEQALESLVTAYGEDHPAWRRAATTSPACSGSLASLFTVELRR
jgi:hypothetical protein